MSVRPLARIEGALSTWNDDRGFGFIKPAHGGQEIFVHISAFPKDGMRPTLGEALSFEIEVDTSGRKRAKSLLFPQRPAAVGTRPLRRRTAVGRKRGSGFFGRVVPLLIFMVLGAYVYGEYSGRGASRPPETAAQTEVQAAQSYRCDGRTHCSQMTSCAEADFFLRNCPNVRMDGNNDGVPCEQQWCDGPFAD